MYELHIANKNYSSWSLRPWVLLSELGIPFEERLVPFSPGAALTWAAFRQFSPTGKVPCLRDGDTTVWDSLAITEYLAERHPGVWPAGVRQWSCGRRCGSGRWCGRGTGRAAGDQDGKAKQRDGSETHG